MQEVLLIGVSHPNEVTFTLSRVVDANMDEQDVVNYMTHEMHLDWPTEQLDDLLIVNKRLECHQVDLDKYSNVTRWL